MDQMDDEIMAMFVEDTREHLADIEAALMDMDRAGADIDEELVNKVFRAAHSIKGGAGFLNLGNVRDLAHKLENLLHMVRSREIVPDTRIINKLLAGFDRLLALVEAAQASDAEDISELLADLSLLATQHLTTEQRAEATATLPIALPGGEVVFTEEALGVRQAVSGGKNLYLVEYDLIHDVQARGKTPLDIITTMESSGLIVDCRMELAAVGDLDAEPVNRIPFYVLYASIVEPDIVGYLFALDAKRIHPVDLDALCGNAAGCGDAQEAAPAPAPAAPPTPTPKAAARAGIPARQTRQAFGPWELVLAGNTATLRLAGGPADAASAREALLEGLAQGAGVTIEWNDPAGVDLALVQVVVAAGRTFAARGLALGHAGGPPAALSATARRAGITAESLAAVGLPAGLLLAS
ncbi:Hpt protein [Solidesulfovibrio carbinoliphilus subsp. oakridgensis]|uniref:Hpt protein n=1 Tax=Solidesulfovibrio carbinoliphilus subsp. oakridgensis TaxID=694327 RepID=G7Q727_9BACT|nr:Hpt domain-containing protein [Solidesulfovibrio carbinoliphilus]EHJ48510.1 Hpt protein [Solidesulfovibrio carbinoliphilus subsp. oakridgensis]